MGWLRILISTLVLLSLGAMGHADATIVIVNLNAAGVGLNDQTPASPVGGNNGTTVGAQRLIALQHAAAIWGATLDSTVEIRVQAQFIARTCTATTAVLASAGTIERLRDFPNAEFPSTSYPVALANKQAGEDRLPGSNDISANFNINLGTTGCLENSTWYYGLDTNHASNQVNLVSVALHEFAHGLGFAQFGNLETGAQFENLPDVYGRRLFDLTQNRFWPEMTNEQRVQSAINTGGVVWTGPAVAAAAPNVLAESPLFQITAPSAIAGSYTIGTAAFGPALTSAVLNGNVVLALDPADDAAASSTDACSAITNGPALTGQIALVDRGTCLFVEKAKNVQNAGAIAIVVSNNIEGSPPNMGGSDPTVTIPAVSITLADGNAIKTQLAIPTTVSGFLTVDANKLAGADVQGRPLMNAPNPVEPGSSISHWDPITSPSQLMEPNINGDLTHSVQAPQDLTLALMRDIGWHEDLTPAAVFSPAAVAFGNTLMGYGSFSHRVTVSSSGRGRLAVDNVQFSGSAAFSGTHDCPVLLNPIETCTVTVVFNPSSLTPQSGTLTVTTNAAGSPHTIALSGTGIADLAFSLSRPRRPLRNDSGQTSGNAFELTITPAADFHGVVALSCMGVGPGLSCAIQPRTVTIAGGPVSASVTVRLAVRSQRLRRLPATETRIIRVTALVGGVARTVELPVQIQR